jgi:hypothetical protein
VRRFASEPERVSARLTVAWTPGHHDGASRLAPTEVELVTRLEADSNRIWICPDSIGANWLEAIASARCSEVVLTARIGDDLSVKHSVLELAERLTFRLTESQPLIRVVFVPAASAPRGQRSHA